MGGGGCMVKDPCQVIAIVIRIFPSQLRNPKWSCHSSYIIRLLSSNAVKNHAQ